MNLNATYKFSTPAFLGGADTQAESLRPPSIKGALRFWWRAQAWGPMLAAANKDAAKALAALHVEEGRLFGSAAGDTGGGQGVFLLRVKKQSCSTVVDSVQLAKDIEFDPWLAYLAGPGLADAANLRLKRDAIQGKFELECVFRRPRAREDAAADLHEVAKTLWLLGILGGLGSRSRRGWGSLSLQSLSGDDALPAPKNIAEVKQMLAGILAQPPSSCPPLSAFSAASRIDVWSNNGVTPIAVLRMAGQEFLRYRGFGVRIPALGDGHMIGARKDSNGKWFGYEDAWQIFCPDHKLAESVYEETYDVVRAAHPARAVFGLPHNLFFSRSGYRVSVQPDGATSPERRASPLLMHVHSFPTGSAALIQTLLPAQFLPAGVQIAMQREERKEKLRRDGSVQWTHEPPGQTYLADAQPDWDVVHRYLGACDAQKGLSHEFPDRETIWPVPVRKPAS